VSTSSFLLIYLAGIGITWSLLVILKPGVARYEKVDTVKCLAFALVNLAFAIVWPLCWIGLLWKSFR
jgi:hypothetical protein